MDYPTMIVLATAAIANCLSFLFSYSNWFLSYPFNSLIELFSSRRRARGRLRQA